MLEINKHHQSIDYKVEIEKKIENIREFFTSKNYQEIPEVPITSNIDPTVRFIGSHISVFKPYLANQIIPNSGIFMKQECIRTHNVKNIMDTKNTINWGSTFPSIGALVAYNKLDQILHDGIDLLKTVFDVSLNQIYLNISDKDIDLAAAIKSNSQLISKNILFNTKADNYYRHAIGMDGMIGRNFNFAVENHGLIEDVGNLIVIEDSQIGPFAVELAIGITTILKQKYNLPHILDLEQVDSKRVEGKESSLRRFEDGLTTSNRLILEGLRPFGDNNQSRILKKYIKSVIYHSLNLGYVDSDIQNYIRNINNKKVQKNNELLYEFIIFSSRKFLKEKLIPKKIKKSIKF
ncbi:hypothetical protein HC864_00395 [Candidatus Gracilibacteria bacterium]|nr:hypothetical protein [Candidatus Gracilibacteria bacterium]